MGLLDDLLKQVGTVPGSTGQATAGGANIFSKLNDALSRQGGIQGLVNLFHEGGLGNVISSWIGTGANLPVSADQLRQVLGGERLSQIASRLGIPAQDAASRLAEVLPTLVDKATPGGTLPGATADILGKTFGNLKT
jgi:uncharacterized protein YidB (DUF937 family)